MDSASDTLTAQINQVVGQITAAQDAAAQKQAEVVALYTDLATAEAALMAAQEALVLTPVPTPAMLAAVDAASDDVDALNAQITALNTDIDALMQDITDYEAQLADLEAQSSNLVTNCVGSSGSASGPLVLSFLHADHLGRPVKATNMSSDVVWDGGITTPFGPAISTAGAFSQQLMFPGQYEDAETEGGGVTLSHNWHRTYDPTLGRYLQSDPIGLAGGLNRYAYVGGNPMGYVDPDGRVAVKPPFNMNFFGTHSSTSYKLAKFTHLSRNINNTGLVCLENQVDTKEWKKMPASKNIFHIFITSLPYRDWENKKYVDRKTGQREMVFDGKGRLVSHRINAGSFNRVRPSDALGHTVIDVLPWVIWGNGPSMTPDCTCIE